MKTEWYKITRKDKKGARIVYRTYDPNVVFLGYERLPVLRSHNLSLNIGEKTTWGSTEEILRIK